MSNEVTHPATVAVNEAAAQVGKTTAILQETAQKFWYDALAFSYKLIPALVLLIVGYLVARFVARLMVKVFDRLGLQRAAEKGEVAQSMRQVGIQRSLPEIVGTIVFWLLMFVFLMATFQVVGWDTGMLNKVGDYIPKVLAATLLVVVGLLVASLVRGFIATSADRAGLSYAQQLGNGAYYVLAVVIFLTVLHQLDIRVELLDRLILIASGSAAVGFALAFGFGGRDVVAGILAGYYIRQRMQSGDHVRIGAMEGTIREVGPVATIVETDEDGLLHRHSIPNTKMLNEAIR